MMRALALVALVVAPWAASADTSVTAPPPPAGQPLVCGAERGPYWAQASDPAIQKLGEKLKLYFAQSSPRRLLFTSSMWRREHGAAVLDAKSHDVIARVDDNAVALVEDSAGRLVGLLAVDADAGELRLVDPATGRARWRTSQKGYRDDSAIAIVDGGQLIVATWHRIATGSRLLALDLATGAERWHADVEQLQVAHSKYYNDVTLELASGILTLRGFEAAGCYIQTFDAATGKRLSSRTSMKR